MAFSRKGQTLVVALRGFKVRPQTLDEFLASHGEPHGTENGTDPPYYQYDTTGAASDDFSNILRARATSIDSNNDSSGILVVVPSGYPHNRSPWVYVAYSYTFIYSQRLNPANDLKDEVPRGFEQLREEILGFSSRMDDANEGLIGFYIVLIADRMGPKPAELQERQKVLTAKSLSLSTNIPRCLE